MQQSQVDAATTISSSSSSGHYKEWLLPCYIKAGAGPPFGDRDTSNSNASALSLPLTTLQPHYGSTSSSMGRGEADSAASAGSCSSGEASCVLHVSVTTCAISPELHILAPEMPKPPGKNYWVLDFGALPVGERATRELLLENRGTLPGCCWAGHLARTYCGRLDSCMQLGWPTHAQLSQLQRNVPLCSYLLPHHGPACCLSAALTPRHAAHSPVSVALTAIHKILLHQNVPPNPHKVHSECSTWCTTAVTQVLTRRP